MPSNKNNVISVRVSDETRRNMDLLATKLQNVFGMELTQSVVIEYAIAQALRINTIQTIDQGILLNTADPATWENLKNLVDTLHQALTEAPNSTDSKAAPTAQPAAPTPVKPAAKPQKQTEEKSPTPTAMPAQLPAYREITLDMSNYPLQKRVEVAKILTHKILSESPLGWSAVPYEFLYDAYLLRIREVNTSYTDPLDYDEFMTCADDAIKTNPNINSVWNPNPMTFPVKPYMSRRNKLAEQLGLTDWVPGSFKKEFYTGVIRAGK